MARLPSFPLRHIAPVPVPTLFDPNVILPVWLVVRTVLWTAGIALAHPNAQIDMIEWGSWGSTFPWGYPKHPPLPGWVAGLALRVTPGAVWGLYLAGYLCSAGCLWVAWRLAREFLPPRSSLIAALSLDALAYLTNDAADFSNNVVLNLLWAATALTVFLAIRSGRTGHWVLVGLAVGASLLTKYSIGLLLIPVAVYVLLDRPARRCLATPGPYVAAAIAVTIFLPHLVWLYRNDFITLTYAAERSADRPGWFAHLKNPVAFLAGQAALLIPVAIVLFPVLGRYRPASGDGDSLSARRFLHAAVLGPVVILLALSLATGCQLRLVWASPLWTLIGVWLLANYPGTTSARAERAVRLRWGVFAFGTLLFAAMYQKVEPYWNDKPGRTLFPGKELADRIGREFENRYGRPVPIAGGEAWRAGNVVCYSSHHPVLFSSGMMDYLVMDPKHTPWTGDADLNRRGGVIVWDPDRTSVVDIERLRDRFPRIEYRDEIGIPYLTAAYSRPARVGWAIVPPADEE